MSTALPAPYNLRHLPHSCFMMCWLPLAPQTTHWAVRQEITEFYQCFHKTLFPPPPHPPQESQPLACATSNHSKRGALLLPGMGRQKGGFRTKLEMEKSGFHRIDFQYSAQDRKSCLKIQCPCLPARAWVQQPAASPDLALASCSQTLKQVIRSWPPADSIVSPGCPGEERTISPAKPPEATCLWGGRG